MALLVVGLLLSTIPSSNGKQNINLQTRKAVEFRESGFIKGFVEGPFKCFRIPGLIYIIESNSGGEIYIENEEYGIYQKGDYFKMKVIGWIGIFMPLIHNGYNSLSRNFSGYAIMLDFEIY